MSLDLAAFAGAASLCLLVVLLAVPVLRVVCGVALLIGIQGVAATAAYLPAGSARRGFTAIAALVGLLLTIIEGVMLNGLGFSLSRGSMALTAYLTSLVLLVVAAERRTVPMLSVDVRNLGPALLIATGSVAAVAVAQSYASTMPRYVPDAYTSVAFAGDLAGVQGVVPVAAGAAVPVRITIRNAEPTVRSYTVSLDADGAARRKVGQVRVPAGGAREVDVAAVTVRDGCLHRYVVRVGGATEYLLTLYLTASGSPCPSTSP